MQELGIREEYFVWTCYKPPYCAFYCDLFIFAYLALLQIVGLVLAFQTRKVKITALNDSTFVAAVVYISSIVLVALVFDVCSTWLHQYPSCHLLWRGSTTGVHLSHPHVLTKGGCKLAGLSLLRLVVL